MNITEHLSRQQMITYALAVIFLVVACVFVYFGITKHIESSEREAFLHEKQEMYYSISKQKRDAALEGSELLEDLVYIKNAPSQLLGLKLIGVGNILTGIFIVLVGILIALVVMPMRLALMIRGFEHHDLLEYEPPSAPSKSKEKKTRTLFTGNVNNTLSKDDDDDFDFDDEDDDKEEKKITSKNGSTDKTQGMSPQKKKGEDEED